MMYCQHMKKKYEKPKLTEFGSVEEVTGWVGGGCGEFLGGIQHGHKFKCKKYNVYSPADFGS